MMNKYQGWWLLLGFLLLILGATSMILQLVGVHFAFLRFLEFGGGLAALLLKVFMTIGGILIIAIANTDWEKERRESL